MLKRYALILLAAITGLFVLAARADYQPVEQKVVDNVYAIVGPLGQRSGNNDGLNANFGFIVTPKGVILIDSGAGEKENEKFRSIYAIDYSEYSLLKGLAKLGVSPEQVTDVILTHLHFDHAGGCVQRGSGQAPGDWG